MNVDLFGNTNNPDAINNYLNLQAQYMNYDSPLWKAQIKEAAYMARQDRKPMIIEYYKSKGEVESVEMYINPNRLSLSTQKLIGKQYTRGGIFYHHWGDDHWTMQLGGYTGLSGMKGIEVLERIYAYSGALLRYTDLGPNHVASNASTAFNPDNPSAALDYALNGNANSNTLKDIVGRYESYINDLSQKSSTNLQQLNSQISESQRVLYMIKNYLKIVGMAEDNAKYNEIYMNINKFISDRKNSNKTTNVDDIIQYAYQQIIFRYPTIHDDIVSIMAHDLVSICSNNQNSTNDISTMDSNNSNIDVLLPNYGYSGNASIPNNQLNTGVYGDVSYSLLSGMTDELKKYISDYIQEQSTDTSTGVDENNDEWLPRQIYIYFEDRIFIGHFDSFNWQRTAETPLIQYDMRFTVTKQVILTSNNTTN